MLVSEQMLISSHTELEERLDDHDWNIHSSMWCERCDHPELTLLRNVFDNRRDND